MAGKIQNEDIKLSMKITWMFIALMMIFSSAVMAKGKIQDADVKSLSELLGAGATAADLINDTKVYVTGSGINKQLSQAITDGDIGGGGGGGGGVNLLTKTDNIDFNSGVTSWTASGGTVTAETSSPLFGAGSLNWDASALNQTLSSAAKSIPVGLQGQQCMALISYKYAGSSDDLKLQVYDGSSVLAEYSLPQALTTTSAYTAFSCPTSGTVLLRLIANVADPSSITIDGPKENAGQVLLGSNIFLAQIVSSEKVGSLKYAATTNCLWTRSSTTYADYSADTDCPTPTVVGKASAPATKIPAIKIDNALPGEYLVIANGSFLFNPSGSGYAHWRFYESVSATALQEVTKGITGNIASNSIEGNLIGFFSLSSQQNLQFLIQAKNSNAPSGSVDVIVDTAQAGSDLEITVYRFPSASQTALAGTDAMAASWSGYHSSDCGWSRNNTAFGDPAIDSSCTFTEVTNNNFGTVVSANDGTLNNNYPGIKFTPRKLGKYFVCSTVKPNTSLVTVGNIGSLQLVDGSSNVIDTFDIGKASGSTDAWSGKMCGVLNITSLAQTSLKIQLKAAAGTMGLGDYTPYNHAVDWSIFHLDQGFPLPYYYTPVGRNEVRLSTSNGNGSTNTKIPRYTNVDVNVGSSITYADSATLGNSFTINSDGEYCMDVTCSASANEAACGFTRNESGVGTTIIYNIAAPTRLTHAFIGTVAGVTTGVSAHWCGFLASGDVIRAHGNGAATASAAYDQVSIIQVNK